VFKHVLDDTVTVVIIVVIFIIIVIIIIIIIIIIIVVIIVVGESKSCLGIQQRLQGLKPTAVSPLTHACHAVFHLLQLCFCFC